MMLPPFCHLGLAVGVAVAAGPDAALPPGAFQTDTTGTPDPAGPVVQPWRTVELDPEYAGWWVVLGDLDGDGAVEVVSARNVNVGDVHHTCSVVAQRLDGSVLWRWGDPQAGRGELHHDVACQIHDWDGDGYPDVVVAADQAIVEIDGRTGQEKRRIAIEPEASDSLAFANLDGGPRPTDVLVKTRYGQIWAYDRAGQLRWTVAKPGGLRTSHQALPLDVDHDGRDEVVAGHALLNPDGSVRWVAKAKTTEVKNGHVDCCRVLHWGDRAADTRLAYTFCGANCLAVVDGLGRPVWDAAGRHYESIDIARLRDDRPAPQMVVDIAHTTEGRTVTAVFDADGQLVGEFITPYSRFHTVLDWNDDGFDEIVLPTGRGIFDGHGRRLATLAFEDARRVICQTGDFTGHGVLDLAFSNGRQVFLFANPSAARPGSPRPRLGSRLNFTLY